MQDNMRGAKQTQHGRDMDDAAPERTSDWLKRLKQNQSPTEPSFQQDEKAERYQDFLLQRQRQMDTELP